MKITIEHDSTFTISRENIADAFKDAMKIYKALLPTEPFDASRLNITLGAKQALEVTKFSRSVLPDEEPKPLETLFGVKWSRDLSLDGVRLAIDI